MDCEQAQNFFDAYLDGELSPSLAAELGAHRLQCADCRRALALLEVSEHILTLDRDPVSLDANFSDRLIACVGLRTTSWLQRAGRWLYVAGPVAAAAIIGLAFLGVFDGRRDSEVAGNRVEAGFSDVAGLAAGGDAALLEPTADSHNPAFGIMLDRAQDSLRAKQRSVESLQTVLDLTLQHPLEMFDKARSAEPQADVSAPVSPQPDTVAPKDASKRSDGLEDL